MAVTYSVANVQQDKKHTNTHPYSYCTSARKGSRIAVASKLGLCIQINLTPSSS